MEAQKVIKEKNVFRDASKDLRLTITNRSNRKQRIYIFDSNKPQPIPRGIKFNDVSNYNSMLKSIKFNNDAFDVEELKYWADYTSNYFGFLTRLLRRSSKVYDMFIKKLWEGGNEDQLNNPIKIITHDFRRDTIEEDVLIPRAYTTARDYRVNRVDIETNLLIDNSKSLYLDINPKTSITITFIGKIIKNNAASN